MAARPLEAQDFLDAMFADAARWHGVLDQLLEMHLVAGHCSPPREPLPQWAVDLLHQAGTQADTWRAHRKYRSMLAESLRLAAGERSRRRFEVWAPRPDGGLVRLDAPADTLAAARVTLAMWQGEFPEAAISQYDVRHRVEPSSDLALLATLIGRIEHWGTGIAQDGGDDVFEIADATGRAVNVEAGVLRAHPVFERMSRQAREAVDYSLGRRARAVARDQRGAQ